MIKNRQQSIALFDDLPTQESGYLLTDLEVYNWGPFAGLHHASIDPEGTAIIGPTGSGKTTLIDALMTLLVELPRYNLASTGGHESDRTLISYVRGVLGGDGSGGMDEVARPAKTMTGLCATYNGNDSSEAPLKLAAVMWTDGTGNAAQDLKRRWIFSQANDQSLERWLRMLHEGGARELMRYGRETGNLRIFDGKKAYLAHARKFFDVGDNAFTLLNRAAGLKQLNSIDEIFRELVLEDRTAFDRAEEVAKEFDNLADIHKELEIARQQQASLVPVALEHKKLDKSRAKADRWREIRRILPVWYAIESVNRWTIALQQFIDAVNTETERLRGQQALQVACKSRVDTLRQKYLQLGGNIVAELESNINMQKQRVQTMQKYADDYLRIVRRFELDETLTSMALQQNQLKLKSELAELTERKDKKHNATLTALSQLRDHEQQADDARSALKKVEERPGSNIPPQFQDFRSDLARELNIAETDLPFLAELIEVRPEESRWRGAIERAIGSERLRILVPEAQLSHALQWVNDRNNRLHVRLQRARTDTAASVFFDDGYTRKLQFKPHPLREAAKALLASRDRHCVDSPQALRNTEHALTVEGMMSGARGQYEKQDQRGLQENWMTGFDNKDQLQTLKTQLQTHNDAVHECQQAANKLRQELAELDNTLTMINSIAELDFSQIDLPGAEAQLQNTQQRLTALLAPDSDSSKAKAAFDAEQQKLDEIDKRIQKLHGAIGKLEGRRDDAERDRLAAERRAGDGLNEEATALATEALPIDPGIAAKQMIDAERKDAERVESTLQKHLGAVTDSERRIIALMGRAQQVDTGALTESGTTLADVPDYLERLRVLNDEALPEKLKRFLEYLNRSSDQGVTQMLSGITEEVDGIVHRIEDLNDTLKKVDFRAGRYLQLRPQPIKHERLRHMETALRTLRSAALKDDQGEGHYRALRELIEILREAGQNRRQMGARALLDPRYRLQFFVVEVSRETGDESPPRTGSQSGSGGEKELMASHILTASLSYALCPAESSRPLYGTVVLDEAFSKSSPSAAGRIIEALRIFNLHPIFVTPNKEIGLLKKHTRKVICVQRPGKTASLASISWEKLDKLAPPG